MEKDVFSILVYSIFLHFCLFSPQLTVLTYGANDFLSLTTMVYGNDQRLQSLKNIQSHCGYNTFCITVDVTFSQKYTMANIGIKQCTKNSKTPNMLKVNFPILPSKAHCATQISSFILQKKQDCKLVHGGYKLNNVPRTSSITNDIKIVNWHKWLV